jgi:hypothetical protein
MRYLALIICLLTQQVIAQGRYTNDMYRLALENESTAPSYVLIQLQDGATSPPRTVCIQAPFLLGAIHFEHKIPFDESGQTKSLSLALSRPGRVFTFSTLKALANVKSHYTDNQLNKTRAQLSSMTDAQLRTAVKEQSEDFAGESRDVVAHVLLERGIQIGVADISGRLYLVK